MVDDWSEITYEEARAAYHVGQKLYKDGRVFLVRPTLREGPDLILWLTDERTLGGRGLLLYPDGTVESK
jgi:hypothetical protein